LLHKFENFWNGLYIKKKFFASIPGLIKMQCKAKINKIFAEFTDEPDRKSNRLITATNF